MPSAMRDLLKSGRSFDEPDRVPRNLTIRNLDIIMYYVAIVWYFIDLILDINLAVKYALLDKVVEFWCTLAFVIIPVLVSAAVSLRMYLQDQQQEKMPTQAWCLVIMLLPLPLVLRFAKALIYALKSREMKQKNDPASQLFYYRLLLKEDADAALLKIFKSFLESAPQLVLQISLLYRGNQLAVYQGLSIVSSAVSLGWCLASYQRAVRFAQQNKNNVSPVASVLLTLWHFLVSVSRIISLSIIAYIYPQWTPIACAIHIVIMAILIQAFDRSPFCSLFLPSMLFSLALGGVYLFTYILPNEGRTRYRYAMYYSVCFLQNVVCGVVGYFCMSESFYYFGAMVLSVVPYVLGIIIMVVYYSCFHPKLKSVESRTYVETVL